MLKPYFEETNFHTKVAVESSENETRKMLDLRFLQLWL
jgi:hypothetical protein